MTIPREAFRFRVKSQDPITNLMKAQVVFQASVYYDTGTVTPFQERHFQQKLVGKIHDAIYADIRDALTQIEAEVQEFMRMPEELRSLHGHLSIIDKIRGAYALTKPAVYDDEPRNTSNAFWTDAADAE